MAGLRHRTWWLPKTPQIGIIPAIYITVRMKINSIKWGLVLFCGWFVILGGAAIVLSPIDSRRFSWSAVSILILGTAWLVLTVVALGVYFGRGWRRVRVVQNKASYIAWLGFETACTLALAGGLVWMFASSQQGDSVGKMRELTVRQDLLTMRAIVSQFTLDKHKRPNSLDDLVVAGYLKQIPTDPMTGRNNTWVLKCSNDPATPGIEDIETGDGLVSSRGIARCD